MNTDMSDELRRTIERAQEIRITNGAIVAVMEGRQTVLDALRDAADGVKRNE